MERWLYVPRGAESTGIKIGIGSLTPKEYTPQPRRPTWLCRLNRPVVLTEYPLQIWSRPDGY